MSKRMNEKLAKLRADGRTLSPGCAGPLWRRSGRTTRSWPPLMGGGDGE